MNKLLVIIMLILSVFVSLGVKSYAAETDDDLWLGNMDELLNSDETLDDTGAAQDNNEDDNQVEQKVKLESASVTDTTINLLLHPVKGYTTYKVYYSKVGSSDSTAEKEVVYTGDGVANVELTGLVPSTEYTIAAKAFDNDGNAIEETASDPIKVTTKQAEQTEQKHQSASDNVLYNPTIKAYNNKIIVSYKPGVDVKKVQISTSEDGKHWKPVAVVDATTTTYTINTTKAGQKYVRLVPVAEDGSFGVCRIGKTEVKYLSIKSTTPKQEVKKTAEKNVGKTKTGPETYFLIILAIFAYLVYARRKNRA